MSSNMRCLSWYSQQNILQCSTLSCNISAIFHVLVISYFRQENQHICDDCVSLTKHINIIDMIGYAASSSSQSHKVTYETWVVVMSFRRESYTNIELNGWEQYAIWYWGWCFWWSLLCCLEKLAHISITSSLLMSTSNNHPGLLQMLGSQLRQIQVHGFLSLSSKATI